MLPDDHGDADDERMLQAFLAGRDVGCPQCGYNVRDLRRAVCPECGERLALRLQLAEVRQAAMLTGLIGLSAGVGLSGLLLVYFLITIYVRRQQGGDQTLFFTVTGGGLVVLGVMLYVWLRGWRWIRTRPAGARWAMAAACWAATLAYLLVFAYTIR